MSYFDDNEDYVTLERRHRRPKKKHYTKAAFSNEKGVDGRFIKHKTLCGLEFCESSGRLVKTWKKVKCKACLKLR